MKIFLYILPLLLLPFMGLAQEQTAELVKQVDKSYKNQIDLNVGFIGVEFSYQQRISEELFFGFGIGGPFLFKTNFMNDGAIEIIKTKLFISYQLSNKLQIQGGIAYSPISFVKDFETVETTEIILGIYYEIWKIMVGIEPSIIFPKTDDVFLATSVLIIKIPLKRW